MTNKESRVERGLCVLREQLAEVEADPRLSYKTANVQINAPLALVQTQLETEVRVLKWAIEQMSA